MKRPRVLLLAPHPFFVERGTPIAVRMLAEALCADGWRVDLVTFAEGSDPGIRGCRLLRTPRIPWLGPIPIGFSPQKVIADLFLTAIAARCLARHRYATIHAVEEAVYPAILLGAAYRTPVIYDLDSSMADQLIEKWSWLGPVGKILHFAESTAIRAADGLAPVCRVLEEKVAAVAPNAPRALLHDVFSEEEVPPGRVDALHDFLPPGARIALYVGNLEHYQGVDLLVEAAAEVPFGEGIHWVVIGGADADIERERVHAREKGVADRIHFLGRRPTSDLNGYLRQADVLLSPRKVGINTPMKLYAYLASGVPVVATDILSHTQVVDAGSAFLVAPDRAGIASGVRAVLADPARARATGDAGRRLVRDSYSLDSYKSRLRGLYRAVASRGGGTV